MPGSVISEKDCEVVIAKPSSRKPGVVISCAGKTSFAQLDSVMNVQFPFSLEVLFALSLRKLVNKAIDGTSNADDSAFTPTFVIQKQAVGQEITKLAAPEESVAFTLGPRIGTKPEDHIYLSCAPLDSEAHLGFLNELETDLHYPS